MILYLHGFRSSPQSFKARLLAERLKAKNRLTEYQCPQLPASPREAMDLALNIVHEVPAGEITLIGSSLGGYYATWLAEQIGCRAVLLNPAIRPLSDLEKYIGVGTTYHSDAHFEFKGEYLEELKALAISKITSPERYFLIAATGDEVLDWHEMVAHYRAAKQCVIEGSNHGISDFDQYIESVIEFCDGPSGAVQ